LPFTSPAGAHVVSTIHDTILQHYADRYPESRSRADFLYWLQVTKRSVQQADVVLTVSEFSREAILEFCERHRLRRPTIYVTYQGINFVEPAAGHSPKGDYVLHLASALPHKRTRWLCETWAQLKREQVSLPRLLLVGGLDAATAQLVSRQEDVESRGLVAADELQGLMAEARALVLPSEIEGFGLPAVEAYSVGTPVEEVLGRGAPGGFDFEWESLAAALKAVLSLHSGEIAARADDLRAQYSWRNCRDKTVAVYRTLC
jgi:glycosyltransferase involved in cell wall biosynthesis